MNEVRTTAESRDWPYRAGSACAWVAMHRVTTPGEGTWAAAGRLASVIRTTEENPVIGIFVWNDDPFRTRDEVLAALRAIR